MTKFIFQPFKVYRKVKESGEDKMNIIFEVKNEQGVAGLRGVKNLLTAVMRGIARKDTEMESQEVGAPVSLVKEKGEFVIKNEDEIEE